MINYRSVAVSGHRRKKLKISNYTSPQAVVYRDELVKRLIYLYDNHNTRILYSGFAMGFDLIAVVALWEMDKLDKHIDLIACIPNHPSIQTQYYNDADLSLYKQGLDYATEVVNVYEHPAYMTTSVKDNNMSRNEYMVDNCDAGILLYNYSRSGTLNFYNHMIRQQKDFCVIDIDLFHNPDKVLQTHSRGDKRFSAICATLELFGKTKTIEQWYQDSKIVADDVIRKKGARPKGFKLNNIVLDLSDQDRIYTMFWFIYFERNPLLAMDASTYGHFHDMFTTKHNIVSQDKSIAYLTSHSYKKTLSYIYPVLNKLKLSI